MKIKSSIFFILMSLNLAVYGQYWQQRVEYKMDVSLNDTTHRYYGTQELVYYNNSPDTLYRVFYHLYNNAFQPGSVMDVRARSIPDPEKPVLKIQDYNEKEIGYLHIKSLQQGSKLLEVDEQGTIAMAWLEKPLLPGKKTILKMEFEGQSPAYTRRSGRNNIEGIDYSMAQWYPKLCEYDRLGWHTDPYIGREFYGVWGDFEVNITLDSEFLLAGTGVVMNPKEVKNGYGGYQGKPEKERVTWRFKAENVHDFVWAADKEYVHKIVPVNEITKVHLVYKNDSAYAASWEKLATEMPRMFRFVNQRYGTYPYPSFAIIQGGDRGMEYPMATLLNGNRNYGSLLGTTAHEFMHQWYYGMLASNEAKYPWMDEGFANYTDAYLMNYMLRNDSSSVPSYEKTRARVLGMIESKYNVPLSTHGDHYKSSALYSIGSYNKGTIFLNQLAYIIGQEKLDETLLRYYADWKFKHPGPEDFISVAENVSQIELDWYLDYYLYSMTKLDYAVKGVRGNKEKTLITIERKGDFIMPVDLEVVLLSGETYLYNIPLDLMHGSKTMDQYQHYQVLPAWDWVNEEYSLALDFNVNDIYYVLIDGDLHTLDIDMENNILIIDSPIDAELIIER